jgi:hypothetical protein
MLKSFLFTSGFYGLSRTLDHAIKHAEGLAEEEIPAIEAVLRALVARFTPDAEHLRAVLVQRDGVVLGLRGRRGLDHEGRANWVIFGRLEGTVAPRASWSSRTIRTSEDLEVLPVPPEPQSSDREYSSFFESARTQGEIYAYDQHVPAETKSSQPWMAGVIAVALITAMVAPWQGCGRTDAEERRASTPSAAWHRELTAYIHQHRLQLRHELLDLDANQLWRFGRTGDALAPESERAALLRSARRIRDAVEEEDGTLSFEEWVLDRWPRDGRGQPIEAQLVFLGPRTLNAASLARYATWIGLFEVLYRSATSAE